MKRTQVVVILLENYRGFFYLSQCKDKGKRTFNQWGAPGGKVDDGESLLSAAQRELCEETGLLLPYERFEAGQHYSTLWADFYWFHVKLTIREIPAWVEPEKMGPWLAYPHSVILSQTLWLHPVTVGTKVALEQHLDRKQMFTHQGGAPLTVVDQANRIHGFDANGTPVIE